MSNCGQDNGSNFIALPIISIVNSIGNWSLSFQFPMCHFLQAMSETQIFDIAALILIGWMTLRGAMRGMVSQLASIAAVVFSWVLATKFSPTLAPMISADPPWNKILAMLIIFVATSLAVGMMRRFIDGAISAIRLKSFDRQLGALFGACKGILLCLVITFFAVTLSDRSKSFVLGSVSGKYFAKGIERIAAAIPEDVSVILQKNLEGFRERLDAAGSQEKFEGMASLKNLLGDLPASLLGKGKEDTATTGLQTQGASTPMPVPAASQEKMGAATASSPKPVPSSSTGSTSSAPVKVGTATPFQPGISGYPPVIPQLQP